MKFLVAVLFCVVVASAAPPALDLVDDYMEVFDQSPADQFKCIADYLGEISKANGLTEEWARTEPILKRHIEDWQGCSQAQNKVLKVICHLKNGFQTFRTFTEYMQIVAQKNPVLLRKFVRGLQSRCGGQGLAENFEELFDFDF